MDKQERIYIFRKKDFLKAYKLADDVCNLLVVLDGFCSFVSDDEHILNILPFIEYLRKQADILCSFFVDVDMEIKHEEVQN